MSKRIIDGDFVVGKNGSAVRMTTPRTRYNLDNTTGVLLPFHTFVANNDAARLLMSEAYSKATVPIIEPEVPYVASSYNTVFTKNDYYCIDKRDGYRLVEKIERGFSPKDRRCTIFYLDKDDVLYMKEITSINKFPDAVAAYNVIADPNSNYILKTPSFSEEGYQMVGQNALCAWVVKIPVLEDAQQVSAKFANRNKTLNFNDVTIKVNPDNVIFTSGFPKIGDVMKSALAISWNPDNNYSSIISPKPHYGRDRISHNASKGYRLEDIEIVYNNKSVFEYREVSDLIEKDKLYKKRIYDKIREIRYNYNNDRRKNMAAQVDISKFVDMYEYVYQKNAVIRLHTDELGEDKVMITFTYVKENGIERGQKFSGMFGNKGTVSGIVDFIGADEYGREIDMNLASAGIIPRTNLGQTFEFTHNFFAFRMLREMRDLGMPIRDRCKIILDYIFEICEVMCSKYKMMFENETDSVLDEEIFSKDYLRLDLHPTEYKVSISNFNKIVDIVMSVNRDKFKTLDDLLVDIFDKNGRKKGRGMVAHMYIRRAKQSAEKKLSQRAVGETGSDGRNKKTGEGSITNNNPVKVSERDYMNISTKFSDPEDFRNLLDIGNAMDGFRALMISLGGDYVI